MIIGAVNAGYERAPVRRACRAVAGLWSGTTRINLRMAEVPAPRPCDRIEIDGDAFFIQGEPVRDCEKLVRAFDLRPA